MNNYQAQQFEAGESDQNSATPSVYEKLPHYLQRAAVERSNAFAKTWEQLVSQVKRAYLNWQHRWNERRALVELESLDDAQLKDIGIDRGQIQRLRYAAASTRELQAEREAVIRSRKLINRQPEKVVTLKQRETGQFEWPEQTLLKKCS